MMMPPALGTGSPLDGLLTATPVAPRPPEADIKEARDLAGRIAPTMQEFSGAIRTRKHSQLEALAFVLHAPGSLGLPHDGGVAT
jgi:hypothetical protein